jgi:hypothetical protein
MNSARGVPAERPSDSTRSEFSAALTCGDVAETICFRVRARGESFHVAHGLILGTPGPNLRAAVGIIDEETAPCIRAPTPKQAEGSATPASTDRPRLPPRKRQDQRTWLRSALESSRSALSSWHWCSLFVAPQTRFPNWPGGSAAGSDGDRCVRCPASTTRAAAGTTPTRSPASGTTREGDRPRSHH